VHGYLEPDLGRLQAADHKPEKQKCGKAKAWHNKSVMKKKGQATCPENMRSLLHP
jgi:hypothetical protein